MVEVAMRAMRVDIQSRTPVLLLQEVGSAGRSIPIFIGDPEATAIEYAIRGVESPRPLTHDLLRIVVEALGAQLVRVVITELREGTYFAELHLDRAGERIEVSARPSDAIALALRTSSPIFVDDALMDAEGRLIELADEDAEDLEDLEEPEEDLEHEEELAEQFRSFLDTINPDDFAQ